MVKLLNFIKARKWCWKYWPAYPEGQKLP
jgi:hypothetical protein